MHNQPDRSPRRLAITVVVTSCNVERTIETCLRAIRRNRPAEIILVDRGSTDRTLPRARRFVDRIIESPGLTPSRAEMTGAQAAARSWVAFVDAHTVLPPDALLELTYERIRRGSVAVEAQSTRLARRDTLLRRRARRRSGPIAGLALALVVCLAALGRAAYDGALVPELVAIAALALAGGVELTMAASSLPSLAAVRRVAPAAVTAMALGIALCALRIAGIVTR